MRKFLRGLHRWCTALAALIGLAFLAAGLTSIETPGAGYVALVGALILGGSMIFGDAEAPDPTNWD